MKTLLLNHTSEITSFLQDDYPYSFSLRCKRRVWIETKKNFGQRFMAQTQNPKNGRWNKPKAGQYSSIIVMFLNDENGHVETASITGYSKLEDILSFEKEYADALTGEYEQRALKYMKAAHKVMAKVEWTVSSNNDPNVKRQTIAEQESILHKLTVLEMHKEGKINEP